MPADAQRGVLVVDDGLALIEPMRRAHPRMRIVVLTRCASSAAEVEAIKLGADDYLAKPITASAVVAVLERGACELAEPPTRS